MKPMHKRLIITIALAVILLTGFFLITTAITRYTGFSVTDRSLGSDFEICLSHQDITLYINTNDPAQKIHGMDLSSHIKDFKIVNCATDNTLCVEKGIDFSKDNVNWIINGNKIQNDIGISELTKFSGCSLIE